MFIQTLGCQMNERESEKLYGLLLSMGYEESQNENTADLVLYNTCCVRETAENKVYGRLGRLKRIKKTQPNKIIVLCGCMTQREEVMQEINQHHKHIDIIFGTFNKHRFPKFLYQHLTQKIQVIEILKEHINEDEDPTTDPFDNQTSRFSTHKAGVSIMHGCNNFCAYCIVPYVRGREKSRKPEDILQEIKTLVADGVKEVMLLGQNVNSYGKELSVSFPQLLRMINEIEGLNRIRFMTSHPKDLSKSLVEAIKDCNKVCKHIHLPMQAGSSNVLKAMNRGYTKEQYLKLVKHIKSKIPQVAIGTDLIVGFPGETEEDFQETLDAVKQARFASAYTFLYSPREGTPAAKLTDTVPEDIAKERFNKLLNLVKPLQFALNEQLLGKTVEVMADGNFTGRTDGNMLVHFEAETDPKPGDLVMIEITGCKTFYLKGRLK